MKLCYICHGYPPAGVGGIETFTQTLARGLVLRGHQVWVVGYSNGFLVEVEEDDQGVHVLRLPPVKRGIFPSVLSIHLRLEAAVRRVVRRNDCQLVECPDVRGSLITGRLGAPLVVRMHGANLVHFPATGRHPPRLTPFFEKRTLRLADHLVAVSQYICDATLTAADLQHRPCDVIYNGVDTSLFRPQAGAERDPSHILFVGRLSETKGAPNLFRALPTVLEHFPNARLRYVGGDPANAAGVRASESLIAVLPERWRAHVELTGTLPHQEMPVEYQRAAVAVFPSRAEAHPIAVVEAMACGTPVVFMNYGPGPEMIEHAQEGLLCDTRSPQAIAEAILAILSDPQRAQIMGARAAKRVAETLSLESAIVRNEAFYRRCLKGAV